MNRLLARTAVAAFTLGIVVANPRWWPWPFPRRRWIGVGWA